MANPTFNCKNCGASVEYSGLGQTMTCPYCQSSLSVPEELRPPVQQLPSQEPIPIQPMYVTFPQPQAQWQPADTSKTVNRWMTFVIIIVVVTVVVPTCLGLFFGLLGILVPLGAVFIPLFSN